MSDIVERLRTEVPKYKYNYIGLGDEAADEIERLRAEVERLNSPVLKSEWQEKCDEVERYREDAERLAWLPNLCDGIGDMDLHEQASIYASAFGREEANQDDYTAAVRDAIDAARKESRGGEPPRAR